MPDIAKVSQGFVECHGNLSNQCDIIIYDRIHYAPLYSYGEIEVIPSQAVFAVIEVKTSITSKSFGNVLYAFSRLSQLGVNQKYLFIYEGANIHNIKKYFYSEHAPTYGRKEHQALYDHDNYQTLPEAIISLSPDFYLAKGHFQDDIKDMKGYMSFSISDNTDKEIACIQKFVEDLLDNIIPQKNNQMTPFNMQDCEDQMDDGLKSIMVNEGFGLVDF